MSGVQQLETHFCVIAKEKGRRRAHACVKKEKNFVQKFYFLRKRKIILFFLFSYLTQEKACVVAESNNNNIPTARIRTG